MEIEGSDLRISKTAASYDVHITGGLRVIPTNHGFVLAPVGGRDDSGRLFRSFNVLRGALNGSPVKIFGLTEFGPRAYLQHREWKPLNSDGTFRSPQGDLWSFICANAEHSGNDQIAGLARNISFSFRAAGIRLRDASDQFHVQLKQALKDGHTVGDRFSNTQLYELYLAFHSVASELGSARDYLAALLAMHHGAPSNINSLARLAAWLGKMAQSERKSDPIIAGILSALDTSGPDPWLARLTEFRNLFLHREPLQRSARFLTFQEFSIDAIPMHYLTLFTESDGQQRDALREFVQLHDRLGDLAAEVAALPAFDSSIPTVRITS